MFSVNTQRHAEAVADAIEAVGADVWNLVEVESCQMLRRVLELISQDGGSSSSSSSNSDGQSGPLLPYLVKGKDSATRQQVAGMGHAAVAVWCGCFGLVWLFGVVVWCGCGCSCGCVLRLSLCHHCHESKVELLGLVSEVVHAF